MERVRIAIRATDPLTQAGLASYLQKRPEVLVVQGDERASELDVVVVSVERLSPEVMTMLRKTAEQTHARIVLVTSEIDDSVLLTLVECHVVAVLPRIAATGDRLVGSILAAARGDGAMPPDLLGELLKRVERLQKEVLAERGLTPSGLTSREIDVLRLIADGMDTADVASKLCYSERTVKNVIYGMTSRLNLRNRSHAVAYAVRAGVI